MEKILRLLVDDFEFSEERVKKAMAFVETMKNREKQASLDQFF